MVPDSTTHVTLSLPAAATLHVAGNFAVNNLTVNSNATLEVDSGTLTVTGAYTQQTGSAVQLAGGAITVRG